MADWGQFEEETDGMTAQPAACQVCESMLPDAVDGVLSEAEQRAFDRHVAGCVVCARELEEAQRGAAWLHMLKQQAPEPSAALLARILAEAPGAHTLGLQAAVVMPVAVAPAATPPVWAGTSVPQPKVRAMSAWQAVSGGFREALSIASMQAMLKPMLQPRMAMTAAMAFFSIALTLNLTGVRLSEVNAASLRPSNLRRTVADRSSAAVRSFQNMRVVYQTEAQVSDLRSNWHAQEEEAAPAGQAAPEGAQPKQPEPGKSEGSDKGGQDKGGQDKPQGSSQLDFSPVSPQGAGMTRKGA